MGRKMPYRLALDLGSTSLGWAVLRLDEEGHPKALMKAGVRIFSDGREPAAPGQVGASLAVHRREKRAMRRRRDRLLKRKERMMKALQKHGFFPSEAGALKVLETLNPYALRGRGLDQELTPYQFGRAIFHLNQRRGFKSNRKTDRGDSDSGALKKAIGSLRTNIVQSGCRSVGEWYWKVRMQEHEWGVPNQGVRARMPGMKSGKKDADLSNDFYVDRQMVAEEFDALWNAQASYHPEIYTEHAYKNLKEILFHQRKLRAVNPGRCTLLPEEQRAALALPSTQRFRILQEVNNLRVQLDARSAC